MSMVSAKCVFFLMFYADIEDRLNQDILETAWKQQKPHMVDCLLLQTEICM